MHAQPRRQPSLARQIARTAIQVDAEFVGVVPAGVMIIFLMIFVPVGLVVMLLSMGLIAAIGNSLGLAAGPLGSIFPFIDLAVSGAVVFVLYRAIYRRLPRRLKEIAADPTRILPGETDAREGSPATVAPASPHGRSASLAELDARLAPGTLAEREPPAG